jgi:hypothetical protein
VRIRRNTAAWLSCEPCEKFNRKTSTPAAIKSRIADSLLVAGPTVATIFVCRTASAYNTDGNHMTIKTWLDAAVQDAERRGLPQLKPLLETLARSTSALRTADWNDDASGEFERGKDVNAR